MTQRVLITLTPPLDPTTGGVQMSTVKMVRMLTSLGYEVGVFSFSQTGHIALEEGPVFAAPEAGNVGNPANLAALDECLSRFKPDFAINQMPYEHPITEVLERHPGVRRIGCLRNTLYSVRNNLDSYGERLLPGAILRLARNSLGRAARLAVHRLRHARDLRRILAGYERFVMFAEPNVEELRYFVPNFDPDRIALIPNSIESVAEKVPPKEKRILWLGRMSEHQKRADLILPLWQRIHYDLPEWHLDVVGDGPMLLALRDEAERLGLPRIVFHGRQSSGPFFGHAAIYLMTSDFEGFPNTLVEAQSHGAVPVVFDAYPMVRVLIDDGVNGLLIAPSDIDGMAQAIFALCNDFGSRTKIAQVALESVRRFEESLVAQEWQELLETVADQSNNF